MQRHHAITVLALRGSLRWDLQELPVRAIVLFVWDGSLVFLGSFFLSLLPFVALDAELKVADRGLDEQG